LLCYWACRAGFNKESEKEHGNTNKEKKRKTKRNKKEGSHHDRSKGLFLDGFLFLLFLFFKQKNIRFSLRFNF
jgi:hypothetical protein